MKIKKHKKKLVKRKIESVLPKVKSSEEITLGKTPVLVAVKKKKKKKKLGTVFNEKTATLSVETKPQEVAKRTDLPVVEAQLLKKLQDVRDAINARIFEREVETDGILVTLIAGASCLFLGDVGAAKTFHIRLMTQLMGLSTFDILLSETTKPDHIFGPVDVPALAAGTQRTKINGYAPSSEVLFFDEIFKANAVVLNPLLWLINEHEYRNGDEGVIKCPIKATFTASNEIPTDSSLKAIYDRLLIRFEISYLKYSKSQHRMLETHMLNNRERLAPILTKEEVEALRSLAWTVNVPKDIVDIALKIKSQVFTACKIKVSDRRLAQAIHVVQASALLKGRLEATIEDLDILASIFWDKLENKNKVRAIVVANTSNKVSDLLSYEEIADSVWDKAIETGDFAKAETKLKNIYETVEKFSTPIGLRVANHVREKLKALQEMIEARSVFRVLKVMSDEGTYYKLSATSALSWTQKQLRSVGFHWYRKGQYWWKSTNAVSPIESKIADKKFKAKILKNLGVTAKIRTLS